MAKKKPSILRIIDPYAREFIPKLSDSTLPQPLSNLYDPSTLHAGYLALINNVRKHFFL